MNKLFLLLPLILIMASYQDMSVPEIEDSSQIDQPLSKSPTKYDVVELNLNLESDTIEYLKELKASIRS